MLFIDDEAEVSSDDEIIVPSSQTDDERRPRKRRRKDSYISESSEDDYDLPSNKARKRPEDESEGEGGGDGEGTNNPKSKYDDYIHVPQFADRPTDTFVTQLTQQWSSPSRIRGARWMKPQINPPRSSPKPQKTFSTMPSNRSAEQTPGDDFEVVDVDDDEIALLDAFQATVPASPTGAGFNSASNSFATNDPHLPRASLQRSTSFRQTTLFGIHTISQEPRATQTQSRAHNWPLANRVEPPTHHDIDREAMKTWVYPTNLGRTRDYQYNIVQKGLFHNLLVALPTGLGKTFIAATIMLNWFRWTESAQIVFVAPTKPLVSQQIDACFNIAGISRAQTTMLTGDVSPGIRADEWKEKRVFFMTPQTLINDLKNGMADPKKIVLVVVDEAHKATGNYAYVEVVRFLRRFNSSFRVLALTATPGATVESVQEVIDGLGIARVEIRTEESLDIREFVHTRNIETEIFDNSDEIIMSLGLFSAAVQPLMNKLNSQNAYWGKDPEKITLFGLKKAWDQWKMSEGGRAASFGVKGMVQGIFTVLMSLAHNIELLKFHGIGPFYHKMKAFADEASGGRKYGKQVIEDDNFKKLMDRLRIWINNPEFVGHPKLSYLKTVVLNHFMDAGEGQSTSTQPRNTRIMIFAHYRDSAEEIVRVLNRHGPMIRARVFVGQSGTKSSEGMDQKTQLDIIKKFKAGTYNTIVATSIGEEGLDIGEVDLIVCYDCSKSPIRMLQRMGRTGRKRAGKIVLLLMRGKEESDYFKAKDNYAKMQEKIECGKEFQFHEDQSPRIVPREVIPAVDLRLVEIPVENTQGGSLEPKRRKARNVKKPAKKFHMPDGVETGFTFLGGKKSPKRPKEKVKSSELKTDADVAPLPSLNEVLLSRAEEEQLDVRFVTVAGMEDQPIQHVRFDAFPEQRRRFGEITTVRHSNTTKSLVKAFKAMRDPRRTWIRPQSCKDIEDLDGDEASDSDDFVVDHVEKRSASRHRGSPQAPSFEMDGSLAQYAGDDSFIDDGDLTRSEQAAQSSDNDMSLPDPSPIIEKRFYVSQQSIDYDEVDEDLPDLVSIMPKTNGETPTSAGVFGLNATRARPGRARRVLDSDDEL